MKTKNKDMVAHFKNQMKIKKRINLKCKFKNMLNKFVRGFIAWTLFMLLFIWFAKIINASSDTLLDNEIKRYCELHKSKDTITFWEPAHKRCTLILQGQIRFETKMCKIWNWLNNNCFGFR